MSVIQAEQLTRRYGRRIGIERLDLEVPQGTLAGFLGPNGSGKTTTIRVLLGFLRPTSGTARVLGRDCWRESARIKRDVGYLPGDLRLYPTWTGEALLSVFGSIRGRDLRRPGRDLADRFGLDLSVPVRKMSRGTRQKVGLILALAHRPGLLVLDEPTASLDPLMQDELLSLLRELASAGHTVFFSSHTLGEVERLCDRVAIVREGRLVADEALARLRSMAPRKVSIRWAPSFDSTALAVPDFLELRRRGAREWEGSLHGPVPGFLAWVAGRPVEDLAVGDADLDSLFRRYYRPQAQPP